MESVTRVLEKPINYFTKDFSRYTKIFHYAVTGESPFFWEDDCLMVYIRSGSGRILVNQTPYPIESGYFGILHSYHVFRFESASEEPLELQILVHPYPVMVIMDFLPPQSAPEQKADLIGAVFVPLNEEQRRKTESLLDIFQQELDAPDGVTPLIRNCLYIQIRRFYRAINQKFPQPKPPLCGELFFYIAANSFHNLSLDSVAREFSLSPAQINRELRRVCKENFQGVLNHSRLSNVYSMMLRSNMSLSAIARESGFANESSFYRIFQETHRMTPQQYRAEVIRYLGGSLRNSNDLLLEIQSYVLKNFRSPINCDSCGKALFLTCDSINQIIQEKYGTATNFNHFLTILRLRYAEGLLTMSDMPLFDAAMDSGFHSIQTFIRLFKKNYGMSPTAYRKNHKGGGSNEETSGSLD